MSAPLVRVEQTCRYECGAQILTDGTKQHDNNGICPKSRRPDNKHAYQHLEIQKEYVRQRALNQFPLNRCPLPLNQLAINKRFARWHLNDGNGHDLSDNEHKDHGLNDRNHSNNYHNNYGGYQPNKTDYRKYHRYNKRTKKKPSDAPNKQLEGLDTPQHTPKEPGCSQTEDKILWRCPNCAFLNEHLTGLCQQCKLQPKAKDIFLFVMPCNSDNDYLFDDDESKDDILDRNAKTQQTKNDICKCSKYYGHPMYQGLCSKCYNGSM